MYYCQDCERTFKRLKRITETHSLPNEPYEHFFVCPFCKSANVKKKPVRHCKCCGARMYKEGDYCSAACRRRGEYLWETERRRKKEWEQHPLRLAIKEVEDYNKQTGKNLSYGQYFAGVR